MSNAIGKPYLESCCFCGLTLIRPRKENDTTHIILVNRPYLDFGAKKDTYTNWMTGVSKMTPFEKIEHIRKTWALFLPAVPPPDDQTMGYWAAEYSPEDLERAASRTGRKLNNDPTMGQEAATKVVKATYAYCGGVLRKERVTPQRGGAR